MANEPKTKRVIPAIKGKIIQIATDEEGLFALTDAGKVYARSRVVDEASDETPGKVRKARGRYVWVEVPEVEEFGEEANIA